MRTLRMPSQRLPVLLDLLGSGSVFEVLASIPGQSLPASFVLHKFGLSWGHFSRSAFCSITEAGSQEIELRISHLNVPRAWHGKNLFRASDQTIESEIAEYVESNIPDAALHEWPAAGVLPGWGR
ncbi:MAG TPA: hypothetical protein VFI11_11140 [Anaerolineales bacterium]|nr:hypothetical protein [Anaerolineales bacterium]